MEDVNENEEEFSFDDELEKEFRSDIVALLPKETNWNDLLTRLDQLHEDAGQLLPLLSALRTLDDKKKLTPEIARFLLESNIYINGTPKISSVITAFVGNQYYYLNEAVEKAFKN